MAGVRPGGYYDRRYRAALQPYWWPSTQFVEPPAPPDDRQLPPGIVWDDVPVRRTPRLLDQVAWWPNVAPFAELVPNAPPDDRNPPPGKILMDMPVRPISRLRPLGEWWPNGAQFAPLPPPADPRPLPAGLLALFPERVWPRKRLPTAVYTQLLQIQTPRTAPVTPEAPSTIHNLALMGVGR